jgi:hypothetical protein
VLGPLVLGSGLVVNYAAGTLNSTGGGGGAVASIVGGTGIGVSSPTGNVVLTNTGVTNLIAGSGISLTANTGSIIVSSTASGGTVTTVNAGTGLTGGPITTSGTLSLSNTGVTAGSYTNANITVDLQGRITTASNGSAVTAVTGTLPISVTAGTTPVVSIAAASTTNSGAVQLSDSTASTLSTEAATSLAVKTAFDVAVAAIPKSCLTGKGALVTATSASIPVALPAGADGLVLTTDAACAEGLKWAASSATPATPLVEGIVYGCTDPVAFNYGLGDGIFGALTTGTLNIAIGTGALASADSGTSNTAVGIGALFGITSGNQNVALGQQALFTGTTSTLNTAIGSQALQSATGDANTALGNFAGNLVTTGSNNILIGNQAGGAGAGALDTGNNNVVIGNCVSVASSSGDCQLAIGVNTVCWLTGNSTGAIKPGAGIIDCASSTGTACQALLSTGSNGVVWGSTGIPSWTSDGTAMSKITGVTTNPSQGNVGRNTVFYRQIGTKEYEVVYAFNQSAPGSSGSGDYLFALPAGLQFDTTLQFQTPLSFAGPNANFLLWALPGPSLSHVSDGTNSMLVAQPLIYSATQFRLIGSTAGTITAPTVDAMGSSVFPFSTFGLGFTIRFQFTAA